MDSDDTMRICLMCRKRKVDSSDEKNGSDRFDYNALDSVCHEIPPFRKNRHKKASHKEML